MKCPNCGSDKILTCTNSVAYHRLRYFECVECCHQSRKIKIEKFTCVDHKAAWQIELEELEKEWE